MTLAVTLSVQDLEELVERKVLSALDKRSQHGGDDILTREEVAKILKVHPNVVVRYVKKCGLPGAKLSTGGEWRFARADVERWFQSRKVKGL